MSPRRVAPVAQAAPPVGRTRGRSWIARGLLALAWAAGATATAQDSPARGAPDFASIEELKHGYLSCNRAALDGHLDGATAMHCSLVYERLKERAFEGDFEKLLEWSRQHSAPEPTRRPETTDAVHRLTL